MNIGLFTDTYSPDINGVVSSTVLLKQELEKKGHTVHVITNHSGRKIVEEENGVIRLPGMRLPMLYGYNLSSPINQGATDLIRDLDLDLIHLQTNFGVGLYGQSVARHLAIPLVMTYHTMYEDYTHYLNPLHMESVERLSKEAIRKASRVICNHTQAVIAPSRKTKEALLEYGIYTPVYIVPSGLNLEMFQASRPDPDQIKEWRLSITSDPEAVFFLYLGRMADEKSLDMLLEAFGKEGHEHWHLILAGDGPDLQKYRDLAASQPAADRLHFLGMIQPENVPAVYGACDAFVSASLSETQGITYLEALASGLMVFGRRDPVLSELIEEGKTGFYFDSADELIRKCEGFVQEFLERKEEQADLCRQKARPFSPESFAGHILDVYEKSIDHYAKTYKVERIRDKDDFIEMVLDHKTLEEPLRFWIPVDEYAELDISAYTRLEHHLVSYHMARQEQYKAYYKAKKKVLSRDMSSGSLRRYIYQHGDLSREEVDQILDALIEKGLLDDRKYAADQALLWHDMGYSKRQILVRLLKKGISEDLAQEAVSGLFPDVEKENAMRLARKLVRNVRAQSNMLRKKTIYQKLLAKGFTREMASQVLDTIEWAGDENRELDLCMRKALRMYASLDGRDREEKIISYASRKGFTFSQIREWLDDYSLQLAEEEGSA